ncbi:phosphotransferase family protein [Ceratobasidium sp. AG-I]|nr:phosphotransferase family protein [Ceratobasidium sp. AG-I]
MRTCYSSRTRISTHEAFAYTSGRWIVDEPARLAERYQEFDIDALKVAAANAAGANSTVNMSKIGEGTFNKVFLMTLDTGGEVVARIPNSLYGPPHPILASEIATMSYVRDRLGVPVPKVLDWCSDRNATPVQAAYMIMEKAPGVALAGVWNHLSSDNRIQITRDIAAIEKTLAGAAFPIFGSLYRKVDLKGEPHEVLFDDDTYAIGPSAKLQWWNGGRDSMKIDRGPWRHTRDYLKAVAEREHHWITKFGKTVPRPRSVPITKRESERDTRELQALLKLYISVIDQLIPPSNIFPTALIPTLRHPDLTLHNVFVSPATLEQDGETKITSIIDWSSSWVGPRFLHPQTPPFLQRTKTPPGVPSSVSISQGGSDLEECMAAYEEACRSYDPTVVAYHSDDWAKAMLALMSCSGYIWENRFIPMRKVMYDVQHNWASLSPPGVPCPIQYSEKERDEIQAEAVAWQTNEDAITAVEILLTTDREGFVHSDDYEAVQAAAGEIWEKLAAYEDPHAQDWRESWPWQKL